MTNAIKAFATLLKIGDGADPEVFTTVAEVTNIGGPSLSLGTEDVTSHSSTDGWREFVATLLDGGEVSIEGNYVPGEATHDATSGLINDMENRTKRNFELVFPDSGATTWAFPALVTNFTPAAPVEGKLGFSATLKITGKPTLA